MIATGTRIASYEITALLGAGGMGEVYRARDARLGRDVALKVLAPRLAANSDAIARFEQEARSASALSHPIIDLRQCEARILHKASRKRRSR